FMDTLSRFGSSAVRIRHDGGSTQQHRNATSTPTDNSAKSSKPLERHALSPLPNIDVSSLVHRSRRIRFK
ncbi:hypothetical protein SHY80_11150, partial [Streptococcus suis]|uniref:hypothetical protein n=1 Tax=Streptococcus suis TaxID=1307 RepID=UPI0029C22C8E